MHEIEKTPATAKDIVAYTAEPYVKRAVVAFFEQNKVYLLQGRLNEMAEGCLQQYKNIKAVRELQMEAIEK